MTKQSSFVPYDGLLRGACHRARIRATRWIAMTSKRSMPCPLVADGAEVLVDAKHDQDEFRGNARKNDSDHHAGDRGQQQDESAERADRHRGEAGENAGNSKQYDQADHQPVERLDDGGRDKTVPLKQILKIEHRSFPQLIEDKVVANLAAGLALKIVPDKSGPAPAGDARR